ncbi:MAG: NUDIX hydrolase [Clostridia bacterium]|nr:NUDIX hydrolase [Clostridia bacterium]
MSDGSLKDREIVVHSGGSAIVAVDSDRKIYLVRQFRSAAGKVMLEIPAGKLEKGEDPLEAAVRELHEETGLVADPASVRKLGEFYGTPGYCSEVIHLYFVYSDLKAGAPHRDQGELLRCEKYDFEDALKMVYEGLLQDAKTVIGITLAASMPEIGLKKGQ